MSPAAPLGTSTRRSLSHEVDSAQGGRHRSERAGAECLCLRRHIAGPPLSLLAPNRNAAGYNCFAAAFPSASKGAK
jgi:hypothetical protein